MDRPPLAELQAFAWVAEHRSFRGAAVAHGVSPSSLSQLVRNLEERLGLRLLNRTTRSVGLTDAGRRLLERVSPALETITVAGAESPASARKIARTIAESPLVKTAFAGEDANWGRIVMAVGRADEPINRDQLSVRFGDHWAAQDGLISPTYDEEKMSAYMKRQELEVFVDVGVGRGSATVWTCDLTKQYVAINGDYRS